MTANPGEPGLGQFQTQRPASYVAHLTATQVP
jgi:hypothetical protein